MNPLGGISKRNHWQHFGNKNLSKVKTVIMIAHRLKTVTGADQVFVMDDGRLSEQGTHEELVKKGGLYHLLSMRSSMVMKKNI